MKTIYIIITLFFGILAMQGQELRLHVDGGASSPFGNFTDLNPYASTGTSINTGVSYFFSKKIGLGLDLGTFNNPIENNLTDFTNSLDFETTTTGADNVWRTNYGTLGPILRLGKNELTFEISPQIGYASYNVPAYSVNYFSETLDRNLIIQEQEETGDVTSIFSSLNARVGYQISDSFGIYFRAGVQTNQIFSDHNEQRLRFKDVMDMDGDGIITEEEIIASPNQEDTFCSCIDTFQTNIGVTYSIPLGGNKPDDNEEIDTNTGLAQCHPTLLKEPYNKETFFAASGTVPSFKWLNHTDKRDRSFVFELYQNDVKLFEKKLNSNSYLLSKRVTADLYKIKTPNEYTWRVRTNYDNCESTVSDFSTFKVSPPESGNREGPSDCDYEIVNFDINCGEPSFDYSGNAKYTGTFTVRNNSTAPGVLIPHNFAANNNVFDITLSTGTFTVTNGGFPSSCPPVPMTTVLGYTGYTAALGVNQTATYCFELTLPVAETTVTFVPGMITRPGTIDEGGPCGPSKTVTLPSCICDTCEDWGYNNIENKLLKVNTSGFPFNFQAVQELTIAGNDPIIEVKAEIISVKHVANDPQCYTCTKHENKMGLFSFGQLKPRIISRDNWLDRNGQKGKDINNDNYTNQVTWRAYNPTIGIDFSSPQRFVMPISLPDQSSLDCCEYKYKVCIRYTFTDINCNTCSEDFCYISDGKVPPIGIGNPSGTLGNNTSNTPLIKN